jgi:hypothetical protein
MSTEKHWDIFDIELKNKQAGFHFFDTDAKRFFASRIGNTVYQGPGGIYFVTSEQFRDFGRGHVGPRLYTVRVFDPATGNVETHGEFNKLSRAQAIAAATKASKGELTK